MLVLQACRPRAANIHTKFKASGLEGNLFSPVKTQDSRLKTAKTIPCSAATTHFSQKRRCPQAIPTDHTEQLNRHFSTQANNRQRHHLPRNL